MNNKIDIQNALNRSLSGLSENPYLARQIISQAKGETKMKRKSIGALALAIILALAMLGTACALFSSKVAEVFGSQYGQDIGDWLRSGKTAQLNETVELDDVTVTLDEIVYRNRGIYGVGTIRPVNTKDVLLPDEFADPLFFAQSTQAKALADKAHTSEGRLLSVNIFPWKIGVDKGSMLVPACAGYYDEYNDDGSLTFSFEVEDGTVLEEGQTYQIELSICVREIDQTGTVIQDSTQEHIWEVNFQPTVMMEPPAPAIPDAEIPLGSDCVIIAPDAYHEQGTLPIYRAAECDLTGTVKPEWFNQSGIAKKLSEYSIEFADHATLQYGPGYLYYTQYSDKEYDYNTAQRERFGQDVEPDINRVPDLSFFITDMAAGINSFSYAQDVQFEHEQLTYLSLADAQSLAENLFSKLGLNGYVCSYALDMSADRIHMLGEKYNQFWYETEDNCTNQPRMDYSQADTEDEGYYLVYTLSVSPETENAHNLITLFINRGGIAYLSLRNVFTMGDVLAVPDALVTPDQAVASLNTEASASRYGRPVQSVCKVSLVYRAVRAENKADGMVFAPVWHIEYKDDDSVPEDYFCWGEINAVSGKLIDAIFR